MAQTTENKFPPVKSVPHAPENINLSKEEFMSRRRKQKEHDALLEIESKKIQKELDEKEKSKDIKSRSPENKKNTKTVKDLDKSNKSQEGKEDI